MAKKTFTGEDGKQYVAKEKKPFYKKWWVWLIVIIIFIGFLGGGDDETETVADNETSQSVSSEVIEKAEEVEEEVVETVGIGQSLSISDVEYVVNEVTTTDYVGGEYTGKTSQGVFLIVNVTITNNGNESLNVSDNFFKLIDGDKEFDSNPSAAVYANDQSSSFFFNKINPDLSLTGNVVFDVSQAVVDSQTKQLEVQTGYWGTEMGLINLQ